MYNSQDLSGKQCELGIDSISASRGERPAVARPELKGFEPGDDIPGARPQENWEDWEILLLPASEQGWNLLPQNKIRAQKICRNHEYGCASRIHRMTDFVEPFGARRNLMVHPDL